MRETERIWKVGLPCLLLLYLFLGDYSFNEGSRMNNLYSFEERPITLDLADDGSGYARLFVKDLCVIEGKEAFAARDAASEAGASFDTTGNQVLYSKSSYERLYPIGIIGVMAALLAVKYGNLSDTVTVAEDAVITEGSATLCGIKSGDTLSIEQPFYGLIFPSDSDTGATITVHMSRSIPAFTDLMNEGAKRLSATGTRLIDPCGPSGEERYITAYDLYLVLNEALRYPEFHQAIDTATYVADYVDKDGSPVSRTWKGSSQFMTGNREAPEGLTVFNGRTGATRVAGYCLVMATKDPRDKEYISATLRVDSRPGLYDNMTSITREIVDQ